MDLSIPFVNDIFSLESAFYSISITMTPRRHPTYGFNSA